MFSCQSSLFRVTRVRLPLLEILVLAAMLLPHVEAHALLTVGVKDTGQYGWKYGTASHRDVYSDTFNSAGADLSLWTVGYDIDSPGEVEVWLNGAKIGDLGVSGNNKSKGTRLIIPAGSQLAVNTLEYRQTTSGYKWGVTNLLLRTVAGPTVNVTLGVSDNGKYGNKFGGNAHLGVIPALFTLAADTDLAVASRAFDADTDDEIGVYLDGNFVGHLRATGNNASGPRRWLALGVVSAGAHTLDFRQETKIGYKYGISDLLLSPVSGQAVDLTLNQTDAGKYGYHYGSSDHLGAVTARFSGNGNNLQFTVKGFDVDYTDETEVLLNGAPLGSGYLATGPNNRLNNGNTFFMPSGLLLTGQNTLTIRQARTLGWKWGVTEMRIADLGQSGSGQVGPRQVAACDASDATGINQIVISPGQDVKSIVDGAPAGAEFLVTAGVYRQSETINLKNDQRMICQPGAIFNGAVLLDGGWQLEPSSGLYYRDGAPTATPSGGAMQPGFEVNAFLNDVFINDELYLRVDSKADVNNDNVTAYDGTVLYSGTFYQNADRVYVAGNPNNKVVEMSSTDWAFYSWSDYGDNVTMENCTIEKYASTDISAAIELKQTRGWLLRNVISRFNHTGGLHAGSDTTVLCGGYNHNGQTGISSSYAASGNEIYSFADNLTVRGAEIAYNNWARYDVQWHAGGTKFFETENVTVEDSRIHDNLGVGLWSDFDVYNSVFRHNHLYNNFSRAIQIEASYLGVVTNNLVECNTRDPDYALQWSWFWGSQVFAKNSPEVDIANNEIAVLQGQAIGIVDNNFRYIGAYGRQQALENSVHDNTVFFADVPINSGDNGYYDYFFQRSGIESDGPATTGGDGALNCKPDSTLYQDYSPAEVDAFVQECLTVNNGFDATRASANNSSYNNTYHYATDYEHFRIGGQSYKANDIPNGHETGSTFVIGPTSKLSNLCNW